MTTFFRRARLIAAGALIAGGAVVAADGTRFSDFTALTASAGPTANEAQPITLGNPDFQQESIAARQTQLLLSRPNSGSFDMIAVNETGPHKGRYLFTVFETASAGVQRTDLITRQTETIGQTPAAGGAVSFDPCYWTPWGTLITAEESWNTAAGGSTSPYGRLFELRNPLDAPGIINPVTAFSNVDADFVHRNIVPRTAHEGIQFDRAGNMYFVDELDGGNLYKYTPKANWGEIMSGRAEYFEAGQTFVLRVGDGNTPNASGSYVWVPITTANGIGLPGTITITDTNGVTSLDARNTTNLAPSKGTDYMRPEDMQMQFVGGNEFLYVTTTSTHEVYRLDLRKQNIAVFVNRSSIDLAAGNAVGTQFTNPDNLAVDHDGNIYIVEDRNGGVDDDIWFAVDLNLDGDLNDPGEGSAGRRTGRQVPSSPGSSSTRPTSVAPG